MRLVLRKLFFLAMCVTLSISGFAQRDIKTFDKIGRDAIIAILGEPDGELYWGAIMDGYDDLQYPDTFVCLDETTSELVGFNTTSPANLVEKIGARYDEARHRARSLRNEYTYIINSVTNLSTSKKT